MNIKQQIEELKAVSDSNLEVITQISNEIKEIEELLQKCIFLNLENIFVEIENVGTLSLAEAHQNNHRYRLMFSGLINGEPNTRALAELSMKLRFECYNYLPRLLNKIKENQLNLKSLR